MNTIWESRGWLARLLTPVSFLFRFVVFLRTSLYRAGVLKVNTFSVPVIVVGNISVGGTGKTPIVSALVKRLHAAGLKPGIVSRGYGAEPAREPRFIDADTPATLAGDEPALLARETGVPICICVNRSAAVQALVNQNDVDVVISDDGLQHYAMHRDVEIAVVDGQRVLGNGWLLPAGPLREPPSRLQSTDVVAVQKANNAAMPNNGDVMNSLNLAAAQSPATGFFYLEICAVRNMLDGQHVELTQWQGRRVHAVAGVGNPQRYFASLRLAGLELIEHVMPDHHRYTSKDIEFNDQLPILVTSKDAVKIQALNMDLLNTYEVMVETRLDEDLTIAIDKLVKTLT